MWPKLLAILVCTTALSAGEREESYYIFEMATRDVLLRIAGDQNVQVKVTSSTRGRVKQQLLVGPIKDIFHKIAREGGLSYFTVNGVSYFAPLSENEELMISADTSRNEMIWDQLGAWGLEEDFVNLTHLDDGKTVLISGPPKLLELVKDLYDTVEIADVADGEQAPNIKVNRGITKSD